MSSEATSGGFPQANSPSTRVDQPPSGFAVAALVIGVATAVFALLPGIGSLGIPVAAVGVTLGSIALVRARRAGAPTKLARAGVILSSIAIVIGIFWFVFFFLGVEVAQETVEVHNIPDTSSSSGH